MARQGTGQALEPARAVVLPTQFCWSGQLTPEFCNDFEAYGSLLADHSPLTPHTVIPLHCHVVRGVQTKVSKDKRTERLL